MTIYWPSNLPLPIQFGASTEFNKGNKITTDMDYGNKRRRQRFTNVPAYQSITFVLDDDQLTQFESFYLGILLGGVVSFYANVIIGADIQQARCTIDDDTLKVEHTTLNRHTITLSLEIYNPTAVSGGVSYLVGLYGQDFVVNEMCDPIQYEVNVHYPEITT